MRTRLVLVAVAVVALVVTSPVSVLAGGAALDFDREWYQPGDIAHASTVVNFVPTEGRPENGPYFAYLTPTSIELVTDPHRPWPHVPTDAIPLGRLDIGPGPVWGGVVSITFTVPDVAPGGYTLTYCNDPCTNGLGDFIGGWTWIGMPPTTTTSAPPPTTTPTTAAPAPARDVESRAAATQGDSARHWVPWLGAVGLVLGLALVAGGLHLVARRRA